MRNRKNSVFAQACLGAVLGLMLMPAQGHAQEFMYSQQLVATQGAVDWESFTIGGDTYLAVANTLTRTGYSYDINSKIYRWDGSSFVEFQSIPTNGAADWESFTIDGTPYLAVANSYNGSSHNINSTIYRWDGSFFIEFQVIPTNGAADWESFVIDGTPYLAVANYSNDSSNNPHIINSTIYRWDGSSFVEVQSILTYGAKDWESFTIGGTPYLAVANHRNNSSYDTNSTIYRWDGSSFVEVQSILTYGAKDWESFTIGGTPYLAVAILYDINSIIYRWDGFSFVVAQSIPTNGAQDWVSFTVEENTYLAVANRNNGYSRIYRWAGSSFTEEQAIPTQEAHGLESFTIDGTPYLAVANCCTGFLSCGDLNSEIFRKETPYAMAGEDRVVFADVELDGSASRAATGSQIADWQWTLQHKGNPANNRAASGEQAQVNDLAPGFYTLTLTVTDNDGFTDTDTATLAVIGKKGDFDGDGDVDGDDLAEFSKNFGSIH